MLCLSCRVIALIHRQLYLEINNTAPLYGVYISQLIRFSRVCGSYHDFLAKKEAEPVDPSN